MSTPRAVGLGGALVGLGGDASAFARNPASLIAVPRSLDVTTLVGGNHGGYSVAGVAFHPFRTLAFGLMLPTTDHRLELVASPPDVSSSLRPQDGRWAGAGFAWKPDWRLAMGARLAVGALVEREHLRILGESGSSARQSWWNVAIGMFVQPDNPDGARVGVAYRRGSDRMFNGADEPDLGEPDTIWRVRRPDVWSFGVSWRYGWLKNTRVIFSVQPEVVRYQKVLLSPAGSELDFRAGAEISFPFGDCVSGCGGMWQLRAGLVSRAAIPTFLPQSSGEGYDPGRRSLALVGGASIAHDKMLSGKLKLDAAYSRNCDSSSRRCNTWLAGLSYRFPSAFRGDLQHHRLSR